MKLGSFTAAFGGSPLPKVADWAASNGYSMLEVACWPATAGADRRYAGVSHIDVASLGAGEAEAIVGDLRDRGIEISALGYYPNPLHPDPGHRQAVHEHLRSTIKAAGLLGVNLVNTFVGNDRNVTPAANFAQFRQVWPGLVSFAQDHGVRVAIENCPMIFSYDEWPGGDNLAFSPSVWRAMFEVIPDGALGLNLDPSHLVWQFIDPERVVDEFGARIYHVHGKDLEVDRDGLYEHGVMSLGIGWQRPRLPGLGEVNWPRFVSALYRNGYDYVLCVEHEDRQFEGTDELVKRGFNIARNTLAPLI